jgi:intein/homing endonuclease
MCILSTVHVSVGIPPAMMKLMYKGILKDEQTLNEAKITPGIKVMVVGSTVNDLIAVQPPEPSELRKIAKEETDTLREPLSELNEHKKIIEKGKPEDALPAHRFRQESLPPSPLSGMINKYGGKVRLHFKLDLEQVWIGTKERTEKVPLGSIRNVISEPIKGHEEYHIMALQLGTTDNSRYWLYWVPSQYVEAIKDTILGKWQYF